MIEYFIKTGGKNVSHFSDYIWRENGFKTVLDKYANNLQSNEELKTLLIKYIVDGEIITFKRSKRPISKYDNEEKEISIDVFVSQDEFWNKPETDRKEYIANTTINAIEKVEQKLKKQKIIVDFSQLKTIIYKSKSEFISQKGNSI